MTDAAQYALITGGMLLANRIWSTIENRAMKAQVNLIEKNTNSLASKLVAAEKVVSHAEGKVIGVAEGKLAILVEEKAQAVPVVVPAASALAKAIAAVPEKTAVKVVEKLSE